MSLVWASGLAAPVERNGPSRAVRAASKDKPSPWADWQLLRVRDHFRARLGWENVPLVLDNDANVSVLAEYIWGAARPPRLRDRAPYNNVIFIEWSRGIGAGIILGGQLYRGEGAAGELGHTVIVEGGELCERCGNNGCLETVAGWEAVLRATRESSGPNPYEHKDLLRALQRATADPKGNEATAFRSAAWELGRALGPIIHFRGSESDLG